jgi:hypothetical protein
VDAGDLLLPPWAFANAGVAPPDAGEVERRARLILSALSRIGLTAFVPGESDFFLGPKRLVALTAEAKLPVVCANVVDAQGTLLFPADRIVAAGAVKVGFFGLLDPPETEAQRWKGFGLSARNAAEVAKAEVASLRGRGAQLVVALLHLGNGLPAVHQLLRAVPGIDWAVIGHASQILETPEMEGQARIVEAFQMGKDLGRLDLHVVGTGLRFADRGQRAQLIEVRNGHRRELEDTKKRAAEDRGGKLKPFYEGRIKQLEQDIAREDKLVAAQQIAANGSWFENRILALDTSYPDHAGVALLVNEYNKESQRRAQQGLPAGIAPRPANAPPVKVAAPPPESPANYKYIGTNACAPCHQPAFQQWQTTKHAHAVESLAKQSRQKDPACIGCHVTGFLRAGGTADVNVALERFPAVGCESCHGPGLAHVTATDKKASIKRAAPESTCRECHTPDQTQGQFDYRMFVKAVVGPGHGEKDGARPVKKSP